jgi:hypothetical protein
MVAMPMPAPVLRKRARRFFTSDATPPELEWVANLSPLHFRLFVVELHEALSNSLIRKGNGERLREVIEDWQATAEIDADPDLAKKLRKPRSEKSYREWNPPGD